MDLKTELQTRLTQALATYLASLSPDAQAQAASVVAAVEVPRNTEHGEFATGLAMQLARVLKRNPMQIAEELVAHINREGLIREVTVAKPGFINFRMAGEATVEILRRIAADGPAFGRSQTGDGTKVLVEFVSANPTGPLHIGHARNAVVGDMLGRLLSATGCEVTREYYFNDAGVQMNMLGNTLRLHVADLLGRSVEWPEKYYRGGYMKDIARLMIEEVGRGELKPLLDTLESASASQPAPAASEAADLEAADIENAEVAVPGHNPYLRFTNFATREILQTIDEDLKRMGIFFDNRFLERSLYEDGSVARALDALRERGVIYEADGAVWFRSTDFGVNRDRVVVKSDGNYTYLMPDIAYNENKYGRGFDRLVTLLGADHHGQVSSLIAAAEALGHSRQALDYIIYGMVTLVKDGATMKLSTRSGEFITLKEMIDEIGQDVVRYFFAMRSPDSQMVFDWGLAKDTSMDNPVYYVQYAHARCCSLFRKAEELGSTFQGTEKANLLLLEHPDEHLLIRLLGRLSETIAAAARDLAPQVLTNYLQEVATAFHTYFSRGNTDASLRFIIPDKPELTQARLALVHALRIVLANALGTLGIKPMEGM